MITALGLMIINSALADQSPAQEVWVCNAPTFPEKYVINGNQMTRPFLWNKDFPGTDMNDVFDIVQNNEYGIVAIRTEAKMYPKNEFNKQDSVAVYANVVMFMKRGTVAANFHEWSAQFPDLGTKVDDKASDYSCIRN